MRTLEDQDLNKATIPRDLENLPWASAGAPSTPVELPTDNREKLLAVVD
jgi:hypothetical protein